MQHKKELREKSMRLPLSPGVYLMKNSKGEIIYVGKAKALKNRVSQYFGSEKNHGIKVRKMVENVHDFDYIVTDSEFEALILECSLIKQHKPKYNILLKDDKGYHYIRVSNDGWPNIRAVKQLEDDSAQYIGPYNSSFAVTRSVDEARKIFKLPHCNKQFPQDCGKSRPCLNYHISQCSAPCAGKIKEDEYRESVASALEFLKGGSGNTVKLLEKQMNEAAENLEFEKAAKYRDRIEAIRRMTEKQKVVSASVAQQDVFGLFCGKEKACLAVLRFSDGRLTESEHFIIDVPDVLQEARYELVRSYYEMRENIPKRVSLDGEAADMDLLKEWLTHKSGHSVTVAVPQRGEQLRLVAMCRRNAEEKLLQSAGRKSYNRSALDELAELLSLQYPPEYIEAYDISHTAGSDNVAGMVTFKDGKPYKKDYKRFSIKGFEGQDDYASMAEVLERRFVRYNEKSEGFETLPDLILLDGGTGQVNAVLPVLKKLNINVPVFGMVKDNSHRTRAIASNGGEIALTSRREAFTLVSSIQEEVHRYAVEYHRKKHKKSSISSSLTSIEGVGEKRAKALMKHFKTISAIKKAEIDELVKVDGISPKSAKIIYDYFRGNK